MPRSLNTSALMKPLVVLALPGMYLFYKYNQYKRQQQEQDRRKVTERELAHLNHKIDKLLCKLEENEPEMATSQEDECVICVNARATMQTYPCGHRVVCRKCFVKTIQMAVSQRLLPLRCVICRSKILRLKQSSNGRSGSGVSSSRSILMPTSASQYSMMSPGSSHPNQWAVPNSSSLFSMTSGSSSFSGMSSVSSATTSSQGSGKSLLSSSSVGSKNGAGKLGYRQPTGALKKSQTQAMKLRVQEIKEPRLNGAGTSGASTSQGASNKDRAASPSSSNGKRGTGNQGNTTASAPPRLPPIKEFQRDYRASKERASRDKATSASTRIRCAQKIVTQLEASPSINSCPPPHNSKKAIASASTSYFRSHSPVKLGKKEKRKEEKKRLKEEKKRAEAEAAAAAAAASAAAAAAASAAREKEKEKEKEKKAEAKMKKEESNESGKGKKKEEKQGKKEKDKKEGKKELLRGNEAKAGVSENFICSKTPCIY